MKTVVRTFLGLFGWLALAYVAAAFGSVASINAKSFYSQLVRPEWAPPGWLFGPVWTILYTLMGVAAWLVWQKRHRQGARVALGLFVLQLVVNALWSWIFFQWRLGFWAFAEVLLLWALIVATIVSFRRVRPAAAWLLLPYLFWVSFAAALTYRLWKANPTLLGQ